MYKQSRKRTVFIIITICAILSLLFLTRCVLIDKETGLGGGLKDINIGKLAYNKKSAQGHTVYVLENERYVPFLVLTDDYNGNVLLLREHLLPDSFCIKNVSYFGAKGSYYPNSKVDFYMNGDYLSLFGQSTQNRMLETELVVTTEKSLQEGGGFDETENIKRKIFILSITELGIKSGMANVEGNPLKYFKENDRLVATDEGNKAQIYWTRTPYLWDDIKMWTISSDGSWGSCPVALEQRVRPAFCTSRDAVISERSDIIEGKTVYVMD